MTHEVRVKGDSRDGPRRGDTTKEAGPIDGTRGIERREGAVGSAQKAVIHPARVKVVSRDYACRVDRRARKRLTVCPDSGTSRTRGIERREGAIGSAQKAVTDRVRVVRKFP